MRTWQLHPQARLRRTASGGAVFLPAAATTVNLDAEGFAVVSLLSSPQHARNLRPRLVEVFERNFTLAEIDRFLRELAERNVLTESPPSQGVSSLVRPAPGVPPSCVPAPESVHLQLNNICNLRCPSCYVKLQREDAGSLPLKRIEELIEEWTEMGVFHLALGGGEPLMSPNLAAVVRAARQRGLVPNVTTNGWLIAEALLDQLQNSLGELRISLNDGETVSRPLLEMKAALLRTRRLRFGWNLIVTRRNLNRLADLLSWGCAQGAATVNLIRPKPAPSRERWYEDHALTGAEAARLAAILNELEPLFNQTALSVDCAFSFLFHGQPARALEARGVAGCPMGERFATVRWNGDVYPCSHLHAAQFKAGNVLTESFREIWERSEVFTAIRRDLPQVAGQCGGCAHKAFCKGCRAVMWAQTGEWLSSDADCPAGAMDGADCSNQSSVASSFPS